MADDHSQAFQEAKESIASARELIATRFLAFADEHQALLLRLVLDAVSEGIVATDHRGHIIYCNPAMGQLLGYYPEELLDQYVGLIIAREDRQRHSTGFHNFVGSLKEDAISVAHQPGGHALRKDGELVKVTSRVYGAFSGGEVVIIGFFEAAKEEE